MGRGRHEAGSNAVCQKGGGGASLKFWENAASLTFSGPSLRRFGKSRIVVVESSNLVRRAARVARAGRGARHVGAVCAASLIFAACSRSSVDTPSLASRAPLDVSSEETPFDIVASVPVPPADGPKLVPLKLASPVRARPDKAAEKIGYLRIGARVARSHESVSTRDCAGGWYAIRPLGFVCAGRDATIRLDDPLARALAVEPERAKPLPYAYAFTRASVPNYLEVPTLAQQLEVEDAPWAPEAEVSGAAAGVSSVGGSALAKSALAAGPAAPSGAEDGYPIGGTASDEPPWWLAGPRLIPQLAPFDVVPGSIVANVSPRHAGVALIGTFLGGAASNRRRFAITTDARLLPADKLESEAGSAFRGQDLRGLGLPVAFAGRQRARFWQLVGARLEPGRALGRREFVPLSGTVRMLAGERMVETRDGQWLRSADLHVAAKPRELPAFAQADRRWIDVSITNQMLVLWEGSTPVYATLVSTGKDGLGDPRKTQSTPQGTFQIQQKHITSSMDSDAADNEFELRDVPWVMYFKGGYALHGAYWHDDFGRQRSHGCVNMAPIDARHVFEWTLPEVPEHWHGAYAAESIGRGTLIRIGR